MTPQSGQRVTLIPGDGIGPEVTDAVCLVLKAAGARLDWERHEAGARVFKKGLPSGVPKETMESIARTKVLLKGPLETPVGYGEKSANVTLRKTFETYGNIRPVREIPGIQTPFSGRGIDFIVLRENVEDLYAGIEYLQTPSVAQCLKLITNKGCSKIARLAFEIARAEGRSKVHCATKSNIMKFTEGMLQHTFERIAREYPDIATEHIIIDNCAHQMVVRPEQFDVIVTTNMNGDIISDLASGLIGGLGVAPSANIGNDVAIFEAVHGSAPSIAGKDLANPTAMLLSAVMMLRHLGMFDIAVRVENAVLVTLEEGISLTADLAPKNSTPVGTRAFAEAIIANLDRKPRRWRVRAYKEIKLPEREPIAPPVPRSRRVVGLDVFLESDCDAETLGRTVEKMVADLPVRLKVVSNRGASLYPPTGAITDIVDHWRCRFVLRSADHELNDTDVFLIIGRLGQQYRWMHLEKLFEFDGKPAFTASAGEA
jgi:isocitrate dehydrogenase